MEEIIGNHDAYTKAKELCKERSWMATYWTLEEDGYDPKVNYVELLHKWSRD